MTRTLLAMTLAAFALSNCLCHDGTVKPPGDDIHRYDPHASLPAVTAFAGPGAVLQQYSFSYVKADGTQDIASGDYHASARYKFQVSAASDPTKPIGAGGFTGPGVQDVDVNVVEPGMRHVSGSREYDYSHLGMERDPGTPAAGEPKKVAPPACPPAQLWQAAIAKGAPANAVARITWEGDDAEYGFYIDGTPFSFELDASCAMKAPR